MSTNSPVGIKDQKDKHNFLLEVSNAEKQLWVLIQKKGLLQSEVQELYRKICSSYEKILLNVQEGELQDIEYSLWKLHYKHIDEFRKIMKKSSIDSETTTLLAPQNVAAVKRSTENHVDGFNSFLSEAAEFYSSLIIKLRTSYGLPEELSISGGGCMFTSLEQKKVRICQFLCHRFLVCLGDIARYREQYGKPGKEKHNWSIAASHYLEATMLWPDSGNPQNQLAVLATYVGDEFLALYHCIRSLAVKEPFPDAWNNLILLFERNRSSHLISLYSDGRFDFLKPYERSIVQAKSHSCDDNSKSNVVKAACDGLEETNLWPLIIISTSFFFVESRLEDFPKAFAATVEMLDALMALDDTKLRAALESYQCMGSARAGPFRALQVVSIFIFVIDNLFKNPKVNASKDRNEMQQLELVQLAMAATFVFMGRFIDRCLKAKTLVSCPLLAAVLLFIEWLVTVLDQAEQYGTDVKSMSATSYFFGALLELLKKLDGKASEVNSSNSTALWEDYELRGFAPIAAAHVSLDFSTQWGVMEGFESRAECRVHRIIITAEKIAVGLSNTRKWVLYDEVGIKFGCADFLQRKESEKVELNSNDLEVKEPHQHVDWVTEECDEQIVSLESSSKTFVNSKSVPTEEEEVILLKPLTRYGSAPLHVFAGNDQRQSRKTGDQTVPADECLRRATSLLIAENQAEGYPFTFHSDMSNFSSDESFKKTESSIKDTAAHPFLDMPIGAGPPSLSSWVLNRGSLSNDMEKKENVLNGHGLAPIEESLNDISVSENEDSVISCGHESATTYDSSSYSAPVPSAPLLPDDAVWFSDLQSSFSDQKRPSNMDKTDTYTDASEVKGFPSWTPTYRPLDYGPSASGFMHGYSPSRLMTSSEWLRQYRESHNLERVNSDRPVHSYVPRNPENFHTQDASRFGLSEQWRAPLGSNPLMHVDRPPPFYPSFPLVYGGEEQRGRQFNGYERPSPYGCGDMTRLQR
ncbi:hypothetical protein HS088_TW21G01248 [Tripterygium wilfordii]|uniref:Protein SMG7L n=1 Tax=Tripterygium wilfordii TaxID=458696 RepID=A0A7J7C4N9_TRIWF|nr:protein SMG7L-like [Tripterygium wilfordii]XP_038689479.1 protein SMG7L-like [Tripterygium wilfordii]XP_038689480.1 protein SMG7L-like [Tripterygium wilfordii]XP_038689481.1 protein SMG7L-like [Tripterygium wilfordii]KAF5729091.1 hypothetical protein HS088_TW21G01248 [Tripterygium wilfordii]